MLVNSHLVYFPLVGILTLLCSTTLFVSSFGFTALKSPIGVGANFFIKEHNLQTKNFKKLGKPWRSSFKQVIFQTTSFKWDLQCLQTSYCVLFSNYCAFCFCILSAYSTKNCWTYSYLANYFSSVRKEILSYTLLYKHVNFKWCILNQTFDCRTELGINKQLPPFWSKICTKIGLQTLSVRLWGTDNAQGHN